MWTRGKRPRSGRGRPPLVLTVPAAIAIALLLVPFAGVVIRTPWDELSSHLGRPGVTEALRLSLLVSFCALGVSLVLGVPLAWLLARVRFLGKSLVRSLVLLPLVLPPTVGGVALLLGFGRRGVLGGPLEEWFSITLPFTTAGAVLAAAFVAMPFLVISLEGALSGMSQHCEETAASLGASPLRVFATVTLPMVTPALTAGAALTWARALGEFGATITFAGNLPGVTRTLPLEVYLLLQEDPGAATSAALLMLATAMAVLVALRGRWNGAGGPGRTPRRPAGKGGTLDRETGGEPAAMAPPAGRPGVAPPADRSALGSLPPAASRAPEPGGTSPTPQGRWSLRVATTGFPQLTVEAEPGTTIAVIGPNGAGKTTLLRALLGVTSMAEADIRLGTDDISRIPTHRRRIAWVPQDGALFPHLTALANTAYGARAQGARRTEARRAAEHWLGLLGVGHLAQHRTGQLSGGQAQRVTLARALAVRPRLLLLDEPFAALDQTTRVQVRHALREHLTNFGGVCLLVTHDPVEALFLADRVLVLEEGRAVQDAPAEEIARYPKSPWVARMLGRNAWPGEARGGTLRLPGGGRVVAAEPLSEGTKALAIVNPQAVSIHRERPHGSPRNIWQGTVTELHLVGSRVRVLVSVERGPSMVAEITTLAATELRLAEHEQVWVSVKATEVSLVEI